MVCTLIIPKLVQTVQKLLLYREKNKNQKTKDMGSTFSSVMNALKYILGYVLCKNKGLLNTSRYIFNALVTFIFLIIKQCTFVAKKKIINYI